jgi:hypothetical protein
MSTDGRACTVILIHGLGDQKESWADSFMGNFRPVLEANASRVELVRAYWANLSGRDDTFAPGKALEAAATTGQDLDDAIYSRAFRDLTADFAKDQGIPASRGLGLGGDLFQRIIGGLPGGPELLIDVANYVGRNGVRTAVQNVLHEKLATAHQEVPDCPIILVSHSQGTIIAYDVLRQAGGSYPQLRTWVTMGCPLEKYQRLFKWGGSQLGVPAGLRWVNLFDANDPVGKALGGVVEWDDPKPIDMQVNNERQAGDAHNHWENPEVVEAIKVEVLRHNSG